MNQLLISILLLLSSTILIADSKIIENVNDLNRFYNAIVKDNPSKESTLIIFDIDDTLLENNNFVGSGKWYHWQRGRESFDSKGNLVSIDDKDKFMCMFGTLGTLFELATTKLSQDDAAQIVNQLKSYDSMILTARTYGFRSATERELRNHGIDLKDKHLMAEGTGLEFILDENAPTAKITYKNGIVMSSGRNKGLVLRAILSKVNKRYKYIYFIDDSRSNVEFMANEWSDDPTEVNIFHYTKVDKTISKEEVKQSIAAKKLFEEFLKVSYPDRLLAFQKNQCN
ncbi:MAG: DUF2608 domain-containing protein [Gammaproteobacteria bacterium]|nr:DUF2608 domain-containing protein [Gammaproteobacteria bacterium]